MRINKLIKNKVVILLNYPKTQRGWYKKKILVIKYQLIHPIYLNNIITTKKMLLNTMHVVEMIK